MLLVGLGLIPECFFQYFRGVGFRTDGNRGRCEEEDSVADSLLVTVNSPGCAGEKVYNALGLLVIEHVEVQENRLAITKMIDNLDRLFELTRLYDQDFTGGGGAGMLHHFLAVVGRENRTRHSFSNFYRSGIES